MRDGMNQTEHTPPDSSPATGESRSRGRRLADAAVGAVSCGLAGALAVWLADPSGFPLALGVGGLALLGAALGYRWGRGIAEVAFDAATGGRTHYR
jgi:hypothetical protein